MDNKHITGCQRLPAVTCFIEREFPLGVIDVLELDSGDGYTTL